MATRLYFTELPDNSTDYFTPAFAPPVDAGWDDATPFLRMYLSDSVWQTGGTSTISTTKSASGTQDVLAVQFILPGLRAQTIAGELKGIIRCFESIASADFIPQMCVRVYDPVTQTFRGTLLALHSYSPSGTPGAQGYEAAVTTSTQRKWPSGWTGSGDSLTSVDAEDGDWLVVELGCRGSEASASTRTFTINMNTNGTITDAPEDETTTTTTYNSWLEFSQTLLLGASLTSYRGEGAGTLAPRFTPLRLVNEGTPVPRVGQIWPRGNRGV